MLKGWRLTVSKLFIIPQRYMLGIMGLFAMWNGITMRMCLSLAITQMVKSSRGEDGEQHYDPDACPADVVIFTGNSTAVISQYATYEWSESTQGLILSGFYYGYAITQLPGGLLAERYGGKWVLGLGLLCTALFTLLTPIVVHAGGATWLFILRVLQGMGEGPNVPVLMLMLARWVPTAERARLGAIVFGGAKIGNIFGSMMAGYLLANNRDWANVFYFFGCFGVVWFLMWSIFCYSTPNSHPYISDAELEYLNANVEGVDVKKAKNPTPWKGLLRSMPVWALVAAAVGHDWGYYTLITDLPKYMTDVLKFNIATTGILTAMPYVGMWICSFLFGWICDLCTHKGWHSIRTGRIIHTTGASTGAAILLILASYAGCDRVAAVIYFIASMALMAGSYIVMLVNILDVAPNYAGSVTALVNGIATISGMITPYLTGLLTPDSTLTQWRIAFWICFAIVMGTNLVYIIWADGKQQWWDDVGTHGYPTGWKHGKLPISNENVDSERNKQMEAEIKVNKTTVH